ncbi:MAG: hypothetical protein AABY51_03285 [Deltaproteobacteria bacterium]
MTINKNILPLRTIFLLCFASIAVLAALGAYRLIKNDPSIAMLVPESNAEWILIDEPVILKTRRDAQELTSFRVRFGVERTPEKAILTLRAMKLAAVFIDGTLIAEPHASKDDWKTPVKIDLARHLAPGEHELGVRVTNNYGPAVMLAYSEGLDIATGSSWEASKDEVDWTSAAEADEYRYADISRLFPRADLAFLSSLYLILPVFSVIFIFTLGREKGVKLCTKWAPSTSMIRWVIILAWIILIANNIGKIPFPGFDVAAHIEYIQYVAKNWRIPLATEGWQMFQSPLYYIVSALPYKILSGFLAEESAVRVLILIPLICGAAFSETAFRAVRYIRPDRTDLQMIGALIGGLLPMNLYMSHSISNETMAGIFSAAAITTAIGIVSKKDSVLPAKRLVLLGILLGLALLSKVTAILLVPVLALMLAWRFYSTGGLRQAVSSVAVVMGVAGLVSAWYYIRNWILMGRPFIGGWDSTREILWWQFPGYRTPGQFYRFGESLIHPVYSSISGFWDSIYSSIWTDGALSDIVEAPWNHELMTAGVWLAIIPTIAIIVGIVASLRREDADLRPGEIFSTMLVGIYFLALLYMYLKVPIFSTAKGSYTMGITPAYAVLCATGIGVLARGAVLKAFFYASVGTWAVVAYAAYFVI